MSQKGAKFLARRHKIVRRDEVVCTQHVTREDWESVPVKDGVRKRPRMLKRKAE